MVTLPNAQFPVVHQHQQYRISSFLQWIPQPGKGNSILNQQQILASHLTFIRYHRPERGLVHVFDELGENWVALTPRPVGPAIIIVAACNCIFKLKCFNFKKNKNKILNNWVCFATNLYPEHLVWIFLTSCLIAFQFPDLNPARFLSRGTHS